jgi:uncharacterized repeat protein (TIGR03837 family)
MAAMPARRIWDVFCRVIDNHGDLGVAWRLCADLAARGERVRLWVDDAAALAWMAPQGRPGVHVVAWTDPAPDLAPGDVVVEAFGCNPPPRFVRRMAERERPPAWINLEYLSAEAYVERSHGLPSPVDVQGRLLTKHFFFPGFTTGGAGLLREPGLQAERRDFIRDRWLRELGLDAEPGERLVSLFCYENPALSGMLDLLGGAPTLLLVTPGAAATQTRALLGPGLRRADLRARMLPYLPQSGYDRLLWACDLNFVRGEDSFVRAQWAGNPFVWQIYPQQDGAHGVKLSAFLDRLFADADEAVAVPLRSLWLGWNALAPLPATLPAFGPWRSLCEAWRDRLLAQPDLATRLLGFVEKTR